MATFYNADVLARVQAARFKNAKRSFSNQHKAFVEKVGGEAQELLSGTKGPRETRGKYGRATPIAGRGRGTLPPLPINRQTGRLAQSMRIIKAYDITAGAYTGEYRLQFVAPYSKFVLRPGGTRKMIDRQFWSELRNRAARLQKDQVQAARAEHLRILSSR